MAYPPTAYPAYPPYDPAAMERQKQVGRTKTGVLLIGLGFVINWIPVVGLLGALLILIGAILVILGRRAFGKRHSLFVLVSIVLFIVGIVGAIAVAVVIALAAFTSVQGGIEAVVSALRTGLIAGVAFGAVAGIASVLFVHELENRIGKYLLYGGYAANIIVGIVVVILALDVLNQLAALGSGFTPEDLVTFQARLTAIQLLAGVSSLLFAGAYFIAYSRISRGEIPTPTGPAPPAPGWPAAAGTGGPAPPPYTPPNPPGP